MDCLVCECEVEMIDKELHGNISGYPSGVYPFRIGICRQCGLVQKKVSEAYKTKMADVYENHYTFFTKGQSVIDGGEKDRATKVVEALATLKENVDWLDYGCGGGHFLHLVSYLKPQWNLYAVDVSAINKHGLCSSANLKGFFILGQEIHKTFDVVSLNMVLEHLFSPLETLKEIHKLLRKDGRLVIRVPHFQNLMTDLFIYEHVAHYTNETLRFLLAKSGFEVEMMIDGIPNIEIAIVAKKCQVNGSITSSASAGGGATSSYVHNR